jgi:hypothetical protein
LFFLPLQKSQSSHPAPRQPWHTTPSSLGRVTENHGGTISLLLYEYMIVLTCVAKSFSNITNLWFNVHHELPRHGRAADPQRRPARRRRRAAAPLPYAAVQARRRRAAPWLRHCSIRLPAAAGAWPPAPLQTTPSPLLSWINLHEGMALRIRLPGPRKSTSIASRAPAHHQSNPVHAVNEYHEHVQNSWLIIEQSMRITKVFFP